MKIAIIGFPGSGKTTVFKAVTDSQKDGRNNSDTSKPSIGTVKVKDKRLDTLRSMFETKKITPEEFIFTDFPGFNLATIRNVETIIHVIGLFSGRDFRKDCEDMETEFMISDQVIIEKKLTSLEKDLKSKPSHSKEIEKKVLIKCKNILDRNMPIRDLDFNRDEAKVISGYQFHSQKPVLVVANLDEGHMSTGVQKEIEAYCKAKGFKSITLCAKMEAEIQALPEDEREVFSKEMGIDELGRNVVIRMARETAGLIAFFTTSFKGNETRAWPIPRGTTAHDAAGKIHTDIKKGFIKAEVVGYEDFIRSGSIAEAKNKGLFRLEGKEYIVKDGDIITFRFNV